MFREAWGVLTGDDLGPTEGERDRLVRIVKEGTRRVIEKHLRALLNLGYRALWNLWTRTELGRIGNTVISHLPVSSRRWVERRKRDLRRFPSFQPILAQRLLEGREAPLVPKGELEERYRGALNRLALAAGPEEVGDYLEFGVYVGT